MNDVCQRNFLVREDSIQRLERVVFAVVEAARRQGAEREKTLIALRSAASAQCERCGARVSGDELITWSLLPADRETRRIQLLRLGCCVREECNSDQYRLVFQNHPDLDWPRLLSEKPSEEEQSSEEAEARRAELEALRQVERRRKLIRLGILIAVVMLLFVIRQLYFGGRIPLIREPEKFHVDPAPEEAPARR